MKKLLFILLMVLSLVISLPAQAAETPIASFDFDTDPGADYTSITGGTAVAVPVGGSPVWQSEHNGRNGVLYFDGDDALQLFAADGVSSLLKDYTTLTISFDYFDPTDHTNNGVRDFLYAAADDTVRNNIDYLRCRINTWDNITVYRPGLDPYNGTQDWNSKVEANAARQNWHTVTISLGANQMSMKVDGTTATSSYKHVDFLTLLGENPVLFLGTGMANDSSNFIGYIDNFTITGSTEPLPEPDPDPNPNPNPDPEPVGPSFALNPFNNLGDYRPSLYNGITLDNGSSVERAIIPIPEDNTIILPSDATRESFTIGDKTYAIKGNAQNPRKLIGWYNIATGEYHPVTDGPATVTLDPTKNNVFYGDWIAASYDFLGGNTTGLITTADTSDFIDINVFDYSDLVNVNSMTVDQNGGLYSEKWSVEDKRENGWLAFSDWGTYHNGGSIGFPNNRDGSVHGYNGVNAKPGILNPADKIISTMFNQSSKPENKNSYVPGINYLGKGNYLFSYDPATGMYSYDCASNAAVYQQSEGRFYVYDGPITYHSDGDQADFFPLNKKTDYLSKENGVPNYWFGMDFTMDFWLPDNSGSGGNQITNADGNNSPMIFEFEGDDDMWVLIDGKLVLDIGGIHDPVEGTINFSTGEVIVKNQNGETKTSVPFTAGDHTMKIYYLERGGDKSNCTIKFNLLPEYEVEDPGIDTVQVSKDWVGTPDSEVPPTITVELYDANKGMDSPAIKTATFGIDKAGKWAHSFSNLPHTDKNGNVIKYAIREVGLPQTSVDGKPYFDVDIATKVTTYSNAWVFTDMAGLAGEKNVVIGNGKGQVLGSDLKAHDVAKMDVANNIITQLASNRDAANLLWTIEPATSYQGGKHFYLKSADGKYLCIKLPTTEEPGTDPYLHLHDTAAQASIFYLNASGDLQDATTGHRLVAKQGGFAMETNVGGNVTTESANKASLYVMRTRETTAYTFKITNTYVDPTVPMGTLQISKTIGGNAADADDEFTFLITLKDANGSLVAGTFDKYEFVNGQCEVTLTGDESISITLPEGAHYTVTERDANGYELITPANNQYAGTIVKDETAKCPFHNEKNLFYTLTVSKTVTGNAADTTKEFAFTVTLTDKDGAPMVGKFGEYTFDKNGQCIISIAHGKSFTIPDLPDGTKYTISEENGEYTITAPVLTDGAYAGEIEAANASVAFVNALSRFYTLTVSKSVTGNAADMTKEFAFTVTLTDKDGKAMVGKFGNYTFDANGQCIIPIAHSESFTIPDLPDGTKYAISEENGEYTITAPVLTDGVYAGEIKAANASVEFVNALSRFYTLTVSKTVTGNAADTAKEFAFTVTLTDKDGKALTGTFGNYTFDEKGQCIISIAHSESFTIPDLPDGTKYAISEENGEYTITAPVLTDGVYAGEIKAANASVEFVNALSRFYTLTVSKSVTGNAADTAKAFAFTVTLTDKDGKALTGKFGDHTFDANGQCVISIAHGKSFTIPDLPDGTKYTISEENGEYTITAPALTDGIYAGEIKAANASVEFVNALSRFYTLTVSKTVTGNAADTTKEFAFTVTLTDKDGKALTGTFGKYTFDEKGQAVISIAHGKSFTITDLPEGTKYTVSEDSDGYTQTAPADKAVTGTITTGENKVDFVNVRDVVRLVKVTDPTGLTVAPKVTVTGSDGSVVTAEALTSNNAAKYLEIPVKPGVTYTVAESGTDIVGYTFVGSNLTAKDAEVAVSGMTFTVSKSGLSTIPVLTLTNSYTLDSVTVTIRKVSTGLAEGIAYPAPKVSIYAANSTAPVWTGTLTPNGSALPVKLLPGTYTVKEAIDEVEGYGFTSVLYVNDAASADKTFTLAANAVNTELRLDNFYAAEFSTLTLTKTVKGESGSKASFSFRITLTDDKGQPITERFPYTGTMDGAAPLNGVITSGSTVALRDGGSITVQLPLGVHYEVEEQEQEGYVLVSSEGEKGVIEKGGAKAAFVNKPQYTATVTKVWEGDTADVRPASVQVQLMLNGKPVGDPVTLNAANGWKHTYTGLDAKGPYTVDEVTLAEGYVSTVEEGEGNTFVITNSYIVLPPTGDAAHPALYLLALLGSAALLMLLHKRKAA